MTTIKETLMEMSEDELRVFSFPENEYKPLWRFIQSAAGKRWMENYAQEHDLPKYDQMKWCERAKAFSEIAGWTVCRMELRIVFNRILHSKS